MPKKVRPDQLVKTFLDLETKKRLEEHARREDRSVVAVVRRWIEEKLGPSAPVAPGRS